MVKVISPMLFKLRDELVTIQTSLISLGPDHDSDLAFSLSSILQKIEIKIRSTKWKKKEDFIVEQLLQVVKKCQRLIKFISKPPSFQKPIQSQDANNADVPKTDRIILGDLTKKHENHPLSALYNNSGRKNEMSSSRKNGVILRFQKIGNPGNSTPSWKAAKGPMDANPQAIESFGGKSYENPRIKNFEHLKCKKRENEGNKAIEKELKIVQIAPAQDKCFRNRDVQPFSDLTSPYPQHQDLFMQEKNGIKKIEIECKEIEMQEKNVISCNSRIGITETSTTSSSMLLENGKSYETPHTENSEIGFNKQLKCSPYEQHETNDVVYSRHHENAMDESYMLSEIYETYSNYPFDFEDNYSKSRRQRVPKGSENAGVVESFINKDYSGDIQRASVPLPCSNVVSDTIIDDFEMFSDSSFNFDVNLDEIMVSDLESMSDDNSVVEALDLSTLEHKKKNIQGFELEPLSFLPIAKPIQTDLSSLTSLEIVFTPNANPKIETSILHPPTRPPVQFTQSQPSNEMSVLASHKENSKVKASAFYPLTKPSTQLDQPFFIDLPPNDGSTMDISVFPPLSTSLTPIDISFLAPHKNYLASDWDSKKKTSQVPPTTSTLPISDSHLTPYKKNCIPVINSSVEKSIFPPVTRSDTPVNIPALAPHKENYEDLKMETSIVFPLARSSTPITLSGSQKVSNHLSSRAPISLFSGERYSADEAGNKICPKFRSDSVIGKFTSGRIEAKENIDKELNSQSAVIVSEIIDTRYEIEENEDDTFLQRHVGAEVAESENHSAIECCRSTETDILNSKEDDRVGAVSGSLTNFEFLKESSSTQNCETTVNPFMKNIATQHIRIKSSSAKSFLLWLIENKFVEPGHQVRLIGETFESFATIKSSGLVQYNKRGFTLTQWISIVRESKCTRLNEAVQIVDYKGTPLSFFFKKFKESTEKGRLRIDISEIKVLFGKKSENFFSKGLDIIDIPL